MNMMKFHWSIIIIIFLFSCSTSLKTVEIYKPQELYRSPALDFTKISTCGIMPVNSVGNEYPEISGILGQSLFKDLKNMQKAWEIVSDEDILRNLNDYGLGRGYQNYIADLNTFSTVGGSTPLFTSETQLFIEELKNRFNIEALLFTSYKYFEQKKTSNYSSALLRMLEEDGSIRHIEVYTALYEISSKRVWWVCRVGLQCDSSIPMMELVSNATQSIGQSFGKGTLRQL